MIRKYSTIPKSKFFITTPIYYVNASPHIGHLYSSLIADAIHRWRHLLNPRGNTVFSTGTDEHGTKVQQAAAKNARNVVDYCREISASYRNLADRFNVGFTDFVRTSETGHKNAVQSFWKKIEKNGHIYSDKYKGWYCVSDENFLTEAQIKETATGKVSLESGHPVEWVEEKNYIFKLSHFKDDLIYWLKTNENAVRPSVFHKIVLEQINEFLPDVSVSRPSTRVHWGIPVPDDETQTVYVWLDALVNYLTVAGYPTSDFQQTWPADVHVIGKDILKFHAIYWPAFLMAANLEPPRSIFCHSHWTVDGEKMSKSKNNVVCPINRSEVYTTDGFRYFLLREGVAHSDGNYSETKIMRILNAELADTLGNLLSRCTGSALNPKQTFPKISLAALSEISKEEVTRKLLESVENLPNLCHDHYSAYNFYKVADSVIATLHRANLFFETLKPWELKKKQETDKLDVVINLTVETLRVSAILLQPLIPNIAAKLLDKINVDESRRTFENTKKLSWKDDEFQEVILLPEKLVLFKRIETEEKIKAKNKK